MKTAKPRSTFTSRACAASFILCSLVATSSFALPSSLVHRWTFNSDDLDEITGAAPANRWGGSADQQNSDGHRSISDGKIHFLGNAWGGGSLSLGVGSLGSGDATVEIWASNDAVRKNSVIFSYSNNGWGTTPTMEACMQWTVGTDANTDALWFSNSGDKLKRSNSMAPYELGKEYHIAMTFHDNGDGTTAVYWQRRNAETGALEKSGSGTVPGWRLADLTAKTATFAIGVWKTSAALDAYASYNEVRVWNRALSEDQLRLNAENGPDKIEMLPDTLAHRWSFNANDFPPDHNRAYYDTVGGVAPQARWGTVAGTATAPLEGEPGKLKLESNRWGGGSIDLGAGVLASDDATLEMWARYDRRLAQAQVLFEYGNPNNAYGQTGSQVTDAITYYLNQANSSKDLFVVRKNGARVLDKEEIVQPEPGVLCHFAFTFRKSGGDTVVSWARRNATTGEVEASGSQTVADWTLSDVAAKTPSFSLGIAKNQEYLGSTSYDANATYDEIRIWNGVLSDDQLTANVFMGPNVAAPATVVGAAGFALADGASFRVSSDFTTAGTVTLGEGSKLLFVDAATFTAGAFALPSGDALADHVVADPGAFDTVISGNTITVTRKSFVVTAASWTGGGAAGDVTDTANWSCTDQDGNPMTGVPSAVTAVTIAGSGLNLQAPAGSPLVADSIALGACTLGVDCDWRGFPVVPSIAGGSMDLNGHKLYLSSIAGASEAKFSGSGELYLDTPSGQSTLFSSWLYKGYNVLKHGAGDLAVSGNMSVGYGGTGSFVHGGGNTTVNGWMSIGHYDNAVARGTATVTNGTLIVKDSIHLGYPAGKDAYGTLDVGPGGIVNVNFSGKNLYFNNSNSSLSVRDGGKVIGTVINNIGGVTMNFTSSGGTIQGTLENNSRAIMNISDCTTTIDTVKNDANATMTISNATVNGTLVATSGRLTTGGEVNLYRVTVDGDGVFAVGGTTVLTGYLSIGHSANSTGTCSVANGTLSVANTLYVGYMGTGSLDVGAGGVVIATPSRGLWVGDVNATTARGTVNVHDGGTINVRQLVDSTAGKTGSVTFDGGVLCPTSGTTGTYATEFVKDVADLSIGANGMTIDTTGKAIGIVNTTFKVTTGTQALTVTNGGALDLTGATFVLSAKPKRPFTLAAAAPNSGSTFTGTLPAVTISGGGAFTGSVVRSADGTAIRVVPKGVMLMVF